MFLSACAAPIPISRITDFATVPYITPYKVEIQSDLACVLDSDIVDSMTIKSVNIRPIIVTSFRKSLDSSMEKTFNTSFKSVQFYPQKPTTGISLVIYKVTPDWHKNSASTRITNNGGYVRSTTSYDLSSSIKYIAAIYNGDHKLVVLNRMILSDKHTNSYREMPGVFVDGIKKMTEDIYIQMAKQFEQK